MSDLSEESRALIEAEAHLDEASAAEIDAMHVRVVALLGGAPAPAPSPDPSPLVAKAAAATSLKVVGSAIAAAVGSSALLFALSQPAPEAPTTASARPTVVAAPPSPAPALAPAVTAPSLPAEPDPIPAAPRLAPAARSSKPLSAAPSASEEALLVAAAEAQLRGGHAAAALALYERHLREYPKGALRQESSAGRTVALCGVGRTAEARADIARLEAARPSSASLLRMKRACGMDP